MSKSFLHIASILLTIIVGAVLFWYYCCDCGAKSGNLETATSAVVLPIEEKVEPAAPEPIDWLAIKDQLNSNPLTLFYDTYKTESVIGQDAIDMVDEIIDYLNNNPDGSILVTGHADITGPHALNMKLGQQRADFIKNYLVQNGIDGSKVSSSSKGPDEPTADNGTPEGRTKNRRAVVLIK